MSDADVVAICLAATSCTVVACGEDGAPLRDCLLWMDQRAAAESDEILRLGDGDAALNVNAQGKGPISAEWMLPKALWLKKHEREIYDKADVICECQDWLNHKCTDTWVAGGCNVATRWHCDGKAACEEGRERPAAVRRGPAVRITRRCGPARPAGRRSGRGRRRRWASRRAALAGAAVATAARTERGTPVSQGGADAFVGLGGLGTATRGGVGVITGSSLAAPGRGAREVVWPAQGRARRLGPLPRRAAGGPGHVRGRPVDHWCGFTVGAAHLAARVLRRPRGRGGRTAGRRRRLCCIGDVPGRADARDGPQGAGWHLWTRTTCVEIKPRTLNHRVDLHAIDATPLDARRRGRRRADARQSGYIRCPHAQHGRALAGARGDGLVRVRPSTGRRAARQHL